MACKPGPLGISPLMIDSGTLCRSAMSPPGVLGAGALTLDQSLMAEVRHDAFRLQIQDALCRGAKEFELRQLALFFSGAGGGPAGELDAMWADSVIEQETMLYDALIEKELNDITAIVGAGKPIRDAEEYRYVVRPLYYSNGYVNPAGFLWKVGPHKILGKFNVWIHQDLADVLARLRGILDGWKAGLADSTAAEVREISGIQIRRIANHDELSNHAFGLAIDVDPYSNPHVVGLAVVDTLNWVVYKAGIQFDFGKSVLTRAERGHREYTADDVMEISNRGRNASNAVRDWLRQHRARYLALKKELETAEATLGVTKTPSTATLEGRSKAAAAALDKIVKQRDLKSPGKVCEPLAENSPEKLAAKKIRETLDLLAADENLRRVQLLYESIADTNYIKTWEERGVLTMPLYLAIALVAELKLRWGEQYESSKDGMHFELMGKNDGDYIGAEHPLKRGERPRTLERLMSGAFADAFRPLAAALGPAKKGKK